MGYVTRHRITATVTSSGGAAQTFYTPETLSGELLSVRYRRGTPSVTTSGIASGDVAYLRLKVACFVDDFDGVRVAVCEPIERNGKLMEGKGGARRCYYVPTAELVRADTVTAEVKGQCSPPK